MKFSELSGLDRRKVISKNKNVKTNSNSKKILITSALPYANGPIHFGHIAGAYLPADCYARFQRMQGYQVLYLCGSDEHGVAITLSAELAGRTPREHVDLFHSVNEKIFHQLQLSFDHYSRTTSGRHRETTQQFFSVLEKKGFIEEKTKEHLYSEKEERFLADRYVVGTCPKCNYENARGDECQRCGSSYEAIDLKEPRSKLTNSPLILRPSSHLYLRFDLFQKQLKEWVLSKDWKDNILRFSLGYIEHLKERAITRDSDWGIPVPGHPNKVFYVWFDAPIGYISAAQEWAEKIGEPDQWKDYWLDSETKLVQFIGKDNIPFHAVFFPAMLMAQDLPYKLPDDLPANEFYLLEGKQFSKTDNWQIDLEDFFKHYSSDQIRYTIAANAPETADSDFSWQDFQVRCNAELLGKLGNLVNRVLVFSHQYCNGIAPPLSRYDESDQIFLDRIDVLVEMAEQCYKTYRLRKACQTLMELAQTANGYFELKKPWTLTKDHSKRPILESCIACCLHCLKALSLISAPIIPETAQKIWIMLGNDTELKNESWDFIKDMALPVGQSLKTPEILFRKIEDIEIQEEIKKLGKFLSEEKEPVKQLSPISYEPLKSNITFDQFETIDLRVGEILQAEKVPKSKKLLKLSVSIGFEVRTIISGISHFYEPEKLVGKKVIVVVNIAPVTIMGIKSQGMILAAANANILELPSFQSLAPGSPVA